MKLYTCDPAPNPLRLKRFMDYKGITLDTTQIDLASEEQLGDAYRAIVPEATVPALILDDGTVLSAVIAIVHYLELLFPEKPLLGVTAQQRPPSSIGITVSSVKSSVPSPTCLETGTQNTRGARCRGPLTWRKFPSWSSADRSDSKTPSLC